MNVQEIVMWWDRTGFRHNQSDVRMEKPSGYQAHISVQPRHVIHKVQVTWIKSKRIKYATVWNTRASQTRPL